MLGYALRANPTYGSTARMTTRAIKSLHNAEIDRCVDIIKHEDGTFGFKEFRRDPEDRGGWTLVSYNPQRI